MATESVSLHPNKLLAAIIENLNQQFFADQRDNAKRLYQFIHKGEHAPFMRIQTGDTGEIFCELGFDHSEYQGKLSFGKFRKSLAAMIFVVNERLQQADRVHHLTSDSGEMLFTLPGIVDDKSDGLSALVCSIKTRAPGLMLVRLMYIDPSQFNVTTKATS